MSETTDRQLAERSHDTCRHLVEVYLAGLLVRSALIPPSTPDARATELDALVEECADSIIRAVRGEEE